MQGEVKKLVVQFSDENHVTVYEQAVIALSADYIRGSFGKSCFQIETKCHVQLLFFIALSLSAHQMNLNCFNFFDRSCQSSIALVTITHSPLQKKNLMIYVTRA